MKVMIVSAFDTYEEIRIKYLKKYFEKKEFEVKCVVSDFSHRFKKFRIENNECTSIKTLPYKRNLSFKRLYSHVKFSGDVFKVAEKYKPDILYVIIPPNSLAYYCGKFKKNHNHTKLIFDIFDLWPETMPLGKMKNLLKCPFNIWKDIRNNNLKYADYVITECDLYQEVLKNKLVNLNSSTLYLCKEEQEKSLIEELECSMLNICYLGSINNIIDIDMIENVLVAINQYKKVVFHIIGDGESCSKFIDTMREGDIEVIYHGKVFDEKEKKIIMSKCHFGLNIMKESVVVGLTMKSIDYFEAGLPILNTIKADTYKLVKEYQCGYNFNENNKEEVVQAILLLNNEQIIKMKYRSKQVYLEKFSENAFYVQLETIFGDGV